jgi:2,3-bisphosphoglycerate-independent phosphoglycerate mutase
LKTDGSLRDISPTILSVLGVEPPKEMTGRDLRERE